MVAVNQDRLEALGPAERIIQNLTSFTDHLVHNRPGIVVADGRRNTGVHWSQAKKVTEEGQTVIYRVEKVGSRQTKTRMGVLDADGKTVREGRRVVGEYRTSGIFPEVAAWMYRQVADVFRVDNEFAARWASWSFTAPQQDLKVILSAFMLVQDRCGDPIREDGQVTFFDNDYRDVGEAIMLSNSRANRLNPKHLLRIGDVLRLPEIAEINRELGFGKSTRRPPMGRYNKVVEKWLRFRELNEPLLQGAVRAGFKSHIKELASRVGYKPTSPRFFQTLGWRQKQHADGRRQILDVEVAEAESWSGLSEEQICEKIVADRPNFKRIVGQLPSEVGLTRAVMAAAIEAGSLSNSDMIIFTPTLEELGLLQVAEIKSKWEAALQTAKDQRASNIARNVKSREIAQGLETASDQATAKAVEEVVRDLHVYVMVDISSSMEGAIERSKACLKKFVGAFPKERLHVSIFNTFGREVSIEKHSSAGVEQAFRGIRATGGTQYAAGLLPLTQKYKPSENEDALFIFVGDQAGEFHGDFAQTVRHSGVMPVAFGYLRVVATGWGEGTTVVGAARELGVPCFHIDEAMFDDPYAVPRILRELIAATPANAPARRATRKTLVEEILQTDLMEKPAWAA